MAIKTLSNEKELLQNIADGDERAFAELFIAYNEPLSKYVFTFLDSAQMCEEIVLDIFVKVWENRSNLPKLHKFTSYLFIITKNYTINCIRKIANEKKQKQCYVDEIIHEDNAILLDLSDEYLNVLNRAIAQLPSSQQKVLYFRQQGLKTREIAEKMGISTDSVKKYQQWASSSVSKFIKAHTAISALLFLIKH